MPVSTMDVQTDDGTMEVHLHSAGPVPPARTVIFFPDAGGVRPTMHDMAQRLASLGFLVALPNVLYRAGAFEPFDLSTVFTDPVERQRLGLVNQFAVPAAVMGDVAALLDALAERPSVNAERVGCVGYCRGGLMSFTAAGSHPDRVAAAASIHGGGIATDEPTSPHRQAGNIRARLYFGVADNDPHCTPENQKLLASALDAAGVTYQLELYPGAAHGFAVPDNPPYDEAAAEQHWRRITALFTEALAAPAEAAPAWPAA
ncbi:MAG: dienelactone hydrolase family protein [Frankia sp.]